MSTCGSSRSRTLHSLCALGLGIFLTSLIFLGSAGCGCSDDLPPGTPGEGRECCCTFHWDFPLDDFADTDVRIDLEDVSAGLEPRVQPPVLTQIGPGDTGTFTLCVQEDHPVGASLIVVFSDVTPTTEYGRYRVVFGTGCTQVSIEPIQSPNALWSPDCGQPLDCCCTFLWLVPREAVGENVVVRPDDVGDSLEPVVVTPPVLTNVQLWEYVEFEVCVDQNHALNAGLNLRFEQQGGTELYSQFRLHYGERCRPSIIAPPPNGVGPQTQLFSSDCGTLPRCCCTLQWANEGDPGAGTRDFLVRIQTGAPAGFDATVTPDTFTNVGGATPITFDVCVNVTHPLAAEVTVEIVEQPAGTVVATQGLRYDSRCQAGLLQGSGEGGWEFLGCDDD